MGRRGEDGHTPLFGGALRSRTLSGEKLRPQIGSVVGEWTRESVLTLAVLESILVAHMERDSEIECDALRIRQSSGDG